ncbi:pimeloyl-ACP methyl ester carboxylesterase [Rhizobium leguminosarum]|uniref:Pimeloyl-ACP methyl ester carboxylesterase n=2 Tax=Rhizobium/Agrobacterium group TaxID=227290 RepID=A0AAE2MFF5_RHILE|nr:pimeloyl-ACP methyl ester carboxylesterase [Rhizobium leguminosarum]MBB4432369.1 pimeloyl-ACP methyl ester carboxylesterase [Rhizobium esperanzae]MBB4295499.1 pimeloyl-ACP methyl ester carboxylesterase [Rhizobium leguminosarum]MBB4306893.1 pimeloyl-ACP methyl ester carboxylesterase [Rhizobium leguminosarum]MBB4417525.1 pimeloyl-ACP methyl ester carboxylesterase [Rhizobium leguminosarum]
MIDSGTLGGHMMNDTVILFHGIARTRKSMQKLANFLSGHGFRVVNVGYPSTRFSIGDLVDFVRPEIDGAAKEGGDGRVHFVGYSMGGLIIRAFLRNDRPSNLGRVVMVGTPNNGSQVADFLKGWPLYRKFYGPAGQQLTTDQTAMTQLFGTVDCELGIIAGNRTIDPVSSFIIGLRVPNDGKVSVESTRLDGAAAHIVIAANHTFLPVNRTMWKETLSFLKDGRFTE